MPCPSHSYLIVRTIFGAEAPHCAVSSTPLSPHPQHPLSTSPPSVPLRPAHKTTGKLQVTISSCFISVAMQLLLWPQRLTPCVRAFPQSLQATHSHYIETGHESFFSSLQILRRSLPLLNTDSKVTTAAHKWRQSVNTRCHMLHITATCFDYLDAAIFRLCTEL